MINYHNCTPTRGTVCNLVAPELAGYSGIHYEVFEVLRKYGRIANGRNEALVELKKLLRDYEMEPLGAKDQSDEEYLSKFGDIE